MAGLTTKTVNKRPEPEVPVEIPPVARMCGNCDFYLVDKKGRYNACRIRGGQRGPTNGIDCKHFKVRKKEEEDNEQ